MRSTFGLVYTVVGDTYYAVGFKKGAKVTEAQFPRMLALANIK